MSDTKNGAKEEQKVPNEKDVLAENQQLKEKQSETAKKIEAITAQIAALADQVKAMEEKLGSVNSTLTEANAKVAKIEEAQAKVPEVGKVVAEELLRIGVRPTAMQEPKKEEQPKLRGRDLIEASIKKSISAN